MKRRSVREKVCDYLDKALVGHPTGSLVDAGGSAPAYGATCSQQNDQRTKKADH